MRTLVKQPNGAWVTADGYVRCSTMRATDDGHIALEGEGRTLWCFIFDNRVLDVEWDEKLSEFLDYHDLVLEKEEHDKGPLFLTYTEAKEHMRVAAPMSPDRPQWQA
jgi:hypothetical protein